jgi:hypothetical protein
MGNIPPFSPDINRLSGENGAEKTTILHALLFVVPFLNDIWLPLPKF